MKISKKKDFIISKNAYLLTNILSQQKIHQNKINTHFKK